MNSNNSEQNDVLSQGSVSVVSAARPTERSIYRVGTQDRGATGPRGVELGCVRFHRTVQNGTRFTTCTCLFLEFSA